MARAYYQFMSGCGYAPQSIIDGMITVANEYEAAYCYDGEKNRE